MGGRGGAAVKHCALSQCRTKGVPPPGVHAMFRVPPNFKGLGGVLCRLVRSGTYTCISIHPTRYEHDRRPVLHNNEPAG